MNSNEKDFSQADNTENEATTDVDLITSVADNIEEYVEENDSNEDVALIDNKTYKNRTLTVATCIFVAILIVFGVWYAFFNNDISGMWETDVSLQLTDGTTVTEKMKLSFDKSERMSFFDNEKSYFSDKESFTAKVERINGGLTTLGGYVTQASDIGEDLLSMFFSTDSNGMNYLYRFDGNVFSGRKLILYRDNEDDVVFTKSEKTYGLDVDKDFKPNNGVVGTWDYNGVTYKFDSDGCFVQDSGSIKINGIYNFGQSDGLDAIIIKYKYNGEVVSIDIPYLLKGDVMTLTINGYNVDVEKVKE